MHTRSIVGLVVSPVITVSVQFVLALVVITVRTSVSEDMVAITWSYGSVVVQFLLALLLGVLATLTLKRRQIRWQASALAGLSFGIVMGLLMAGDFGDLFSVSVLVLTAVSWTIGFVCFWAIALRSNRAPAGGESAQSL